jgi:hypothetical protein
MVGTLIDIAKTLGGIAGIAALGWRFVEESTGYLHIALKIDGPAEESNRVTALTTIENKRTRKMKMSNTLLLVSPEAMSPIEASRIVARTSGYSGQLDYTNDIEKLRLDNPVYVDGCAVIPLHFYFSENVRVGNEMLTYRAPVDVSRLLLDTEYSVRFYIFGERRLHRSVQDGFYNRRKSN